jgi:predicted ribosomally synthesized peptide with SipW-like signal peptide
MNKKILASIFVIGILALAMGYGTYSYFSDTETSTGNKFQAGTLDLGSVYVTTFPFVDVKPSEELVPFEISYTNIGQNPGHISWSLTYEENDKYTNPEPTWFEFREMDMSADEFAKLVYVKDVKFDRDCDGIYEPTLSGTSYYGKIDGVEVYESNWWSFTDAQRRNFIATAGWEGAPHVTFDEWVLPDWIRWADYIHGNKDGYLSIYEIKNVPSWNVDDTKGTAALDPNDTYKHSVTLHLGDSLSPEGWILHDVLDNWPQADGIEITFTVVMTQVP